MLLLGEKKYRLTSCGIMGRPLPFWGVSSDVEEDFFFSFIGIRVGTVV